MKNVALLLLLIVGFQQTLQAQKYKDLMEDTSVNFYDVVKEGETYFKTVDLTVKGSGYKQFLRWKNNNEYKFFPSGRRDNLDPYLAKNSLEVFRANTSNQLSSQSRLMASSGWRELGPISVDNITGHYAAGIGRVEDVYVDPTNKEKLYLGSRSGGLWRSTDEGATWVGGSTDFLPGCGVNTITADKDNSDILFMNLQNSNNQNSYGIYKSTDAGATVTESAFNPGNLGEGGLGDNLRVYRVIYHPSTDGLLFIGTNRGLYRSDDDLVTYSKVAEGNYFQIIFHPTNSQIIYTQNRASNTTKNYLSKSTNGGLNFVQTTEITANNSNEAKLAVTPAEPNSVFWGISAGLFKSTNLGESFSLINNNLGTGVGGFSVHTTNASNILLGYVDLFNSTDAGASFTQRTRWSLGDANFHPTQNDFQYNYENSTAYVHADTNLSSCVNGVFYAMTDGMLAKSEDGGENWTNLMRSGVGIRENYKLGVSQSNNGLSVSGSQDNGSSIYKDTGWIEFAGGDGMEGIVHPLNDDWIISSAQFGHRRRTKDGGSSQDSATPNSSEDGDWIAPLAYDPNDHMTIYDFRDGVRKSTDFGSNHTLMGRPDFESTHNLKIAQAEIAQNDSNIMVMLPYAGEHFEKSTDGGVTYTSIRAGLPNSFIRDIAFDPLDDDTIIVVNASHQDNGNKVYITTNGGSNWTNITYNLGNIPVHSVVIDHQDSKNIYLGTEVGVFTKHMTANSWLLYNTDLPNTTVTEMEINWGANTIKAATWGRGLWEGDLVGRADYPSINYTEITDAPTDSPPTETENQFVTSVIAYDGALSSVYVRWSRGDTPDFSNADNTIKMSNTPNTKRWVSDSGIPGQAGKKTFFKVFAEGANGETSETYKFMYNMDEFLCDSDYDYSITTGDDHIKRVTVGSTSNATYFENTSGNDGRTLYNFLDPVEYKIGEVYSIEIELEQFSTYDKAGAWIDYNNNSELEENEQITMSAYNADTNIATGSFTVPETAQLDTPLYFRIKNSFIPLDNPVGPCFQSVYGEVEDYLVTIGASVLSIKEETLNANLVMYPNPTSDTLFFSVNNMIINSIDIYDLTGKKIISKTFTNSDYQLDISSLSSANYFLFIYSNTGEVVKHLIKN